MNRREFLQHSEATPLRTLQDELPEPVKECEKSIREDNPDMDRSTAIAICRDMNQRGVLTDWLEATPDEDDVTRLEQRAMAEFRNPGDIQRVEEGSGVRYKRVMLLSPGTWADAGSQEHVEYNADAIRASADNWVDLEAIRQHVPSWHELSNDERAQRLAQLDEEVALEDAAPINFLHGPAMYGAESLDEIGEIPLDSIIVDDQGRLYADLVLDGQSPQSETAIDLMDETLEAAQNPDADPPRVGPSVEIPADHTEIDETGVKSLEEAFFSAVGIVFGPASRPVELGEQARERAIAMAGATNTGNSGVLLRGDHADGNGKTAADTACKAMPRHRRGMDSFDPEDMDDEELAETLRTMQEDMAALQRALQDLAAILDVIEQAESEGFDSSTSTVAELVTFIQENLNADDEVITELQDAADAFLETVEADSLEAASAEAMRDWVAQQNGAEDDENEGEGGNSEEMDEEQAATMEELEQVKEVVGQVADHMGDIKDMLQAHEDKRETELTDLERRLSELENEPVTRSLSGQPESEEFLEEDDESDAAASSGRPMM